MSASSARRLDVSTDRRYQLLVEAVEKIQDYAIFAMDPHGNILTWNLGAERIKGYTADEIIGRNFTTFYTPEDIQRNHPQEELKLARENGVYQEEGWRLRKDGSRFWASILITRLTDSEGKLVGFSKVTRDLTERRQAEEALRASEERFRLLISSVRDYAILMLDPQGNVISWNEGARRIKGYEADEILGKHFSVFYPREDIQSGKCDYDLREAEVTGRYEDEGWRVRKDGTRFWASVVISSIRNSAGKLTGFSKVTRDLTERKRAEDKLRRAYQELEKRVQERTEELAIANRELAAAVQSRDEFLSIASHELKTPVTSLKLQIQMLKRIPIDPDRLAKALGTSERQVDRLAELLDALLDVSRLQNKTLTMHFERQDLGAVVREVVDRMREQFRALGSDLRVSADLRAPMNMDRLRMEQVIENLLGNALKYAPGAPVNVSIAVLPGTVRLIVSDEGPGIPPEKHARIFERFERAVPSNDVSGLGLGLFIAKRIIEEHHGKISVQSVPGQGSAFVIELPLA